MKLKHSERKETTTTTNATRNAFAAAAVLTGTLATIAAAQDSTKVANSTATQVKDEYQIVKMTMGVRPVKAGDTLFVMINPADSLSILLKVDGISDTGATISSIETLDTRCSVIPLHVTGARNTTITTDMVVASNHTVGRGYNEQLVLAFGVKTQVGAFQVNVEKGDAPGTARVEYTIMEIPYPLPKVLPSDHPK